MSVIHHIELMVSDRETVKTFYKTVLIGLGFKQASERMFVKDDFLLLLPEPDVAGKYQHGALGLHHLAFSVDSKAEVDRFYNEVLLKLDGVQIEDPPVDCPEYGYEEYYATFFYDPDGIKWEVVYTRPGNVGRF